MLVVEDDRAVRDLLETVLAVEGFTVYTARDGLEGLLMVRIHRPAVVVLDLMMPDLGGLRVLEELADEHADVAVFVVTGNPDAAAVARLRLDADRVLTKPFEIDDLLARIVQTVEKA